MEPYVHFTESRNKERIQSGALVIKMGIWQSWGYLLIEEGKEVPHHYQNRPGQGQEEFADVKRPLIEIIYSYRQKRTRSGAFQLSHLKQNIVVPNFISEHK